MEEGARLSTECSLWRPTYFSLLFHTDINQTIIPFISVANRARFCKCYRTHKEPPTDLTNQFASYSLIDEEALREGRYIIYRED